MPDSGHPAWDNGTFASFHHCALEGLDLSRRCVCTAPRRFNSFPPGAPERVPADGTAYPKGLCAAWAASLVVQLLAVGAEPAPTNLAPTAAPTQEAQAVVGRQPRRRLPALVSEWCSVHS